MNHSFSAVLTLCFLLIGCASPATTPSPAEEDPQVAEVDGDTGWDTGWDTDSDTGWDGVPMPPPSCSGSACDGQDPVAMGCTGLTTLANGTTGGVSWAMRYSSVCKTKFVRAWRHSTAGDVQAQVLRESDLLTYQINEVALPALSKKDSTMVYCPSGSCRALVCVRDGSASSYSCTDWK